MTNPVAFKYRPEIDGLRAVAVAGVVGFHAFPAVIPGGYVGVDVFFVISGFLITSIIVDGLNHDHFSLIGFYIRRTRRIFPALALVLAACLAAGWVLLLPSEFIALGKHTAAGATFITNFVQLDEAGYFDVSAELKPLLHLWSLGIEEQFYLAWPLIAMAAFRLGKRVFNAALAIVIVSFVINMAMTYKHPNSAFYLPWPRAWELLLGGCLATLPSFLRATSAMSRNLAAFAGATLICIAVAFFDHNSAFPGWRALLPTGGTALIIWAGSDAWLNRRVLAQPLPVGIGLISYPLYLWHWPLLSFLAINNDRSISSRFVAIAITIVLAWATYHFVEQPIRHARRTVWRPIIAGLACVGCVGILAFVAILPAKSSSPELRSIENAADDFLYPAGVPINFKDQTFYRDGIGSHPVLFIGDSNMQQYYPRLHDMVARTNTSAIYATHGGCMPIRKVSTPAIPPCVRFVEQAYEFARSSDAKAVVIAAQWNGYFTSGTYFYDSTPLTQQTASEKALTDLQADIHALVRAGKQVYVVLNIPIGVEFSPAYRLNRTSTGIELLPVKAVPRALLPPIYKQIAENLSGAAAAAGATVIDPLSFLCDAAACRTANSDRSPIYKDGVHLRASYVRENIDYLDQAFSEPIQQSTTAAH
jgi:peptidoglycan/LPS O-acetylase OafA/YrhL